MGIEIDLFFVCVANIDMISVWGVEIDLMSEYGWELTWFLCRGQKWLGFSVLIEID